MTPARWIDLGCNYGLDGKGRPLILVEGDPNRGQYSFNGETGDRWFARGDAGRAVTVWQVERRPRATVEEHSFQVPLLRRWSIPSAGRIKPR